MIRVLDDLTIDKIAAGEVIEKPLNVVKELVENSIDAGSTNISVEIKNGGIDYIRVTDNGCGIEYSDIKLAFQRHATSKIVSSEDLNYLHTLGFRGEALASICSVSRVTMVTKTVNELSGIKAYTEGGEDFGIEEVGAPDGTTLIVEDLFYNVPARKKFLKAPSTEGSYIFELMQELALSRPDIAFKMIINGSVKFSTTGNGRLKDVIYNIYGQEVTDNLINVECNELGYEIKGYLGKPYISKGSRSYENYFVNNRYVKCNALQKGLEEGYNKYLMQHRFPFCVLHLSVDSANVDVNIHPSKMMLRVANEEALANLVMKMVEEALTRQDYITDVPIGNETNDKLEAVRTPEPFEVNRLQKETEAVVKNIDITFEDEEESVKEESEEADIFAKANERFSESKVLYDAINPENEADDKTLAHEELYKPKEVAPPDNKPKDVIVDKVKQMTVFDDERFLNKDNFKDYEIIGQVFGTYWIIAFKDKMYLMDQHAAHEKVKYEQFIKKIRSDDVMTQMLNPGIVMSLTPSKYEICMNNMDIFNKLGFEVDTFGDLDIKLNGIPAVLYGNDPKLLFEEILSDLESLGYVKDSRLLEEKVATMGCKAAIKGNTIIPRAEVEELFRELFTLDNPYFCPHGRPTLIAMTKAELDKKFKRIV